MNPTRVWLPSLSQVHESVSMHRAGHCHSLSPTCLPFLAEGHLGRLLFQLSAITNTVGTFHAGSVCRCFQISWVNLCERFGIVCDAVGFCQKSPSCPPKWPPRLPPSPPPALVGAPASSTPSGHSVSPGLWVVASPVGVRCALAVVTPTLFRDCCVHTYMTCVHVFILCGSRLELVPVLLGHLFYQVWRTLGSNPA